MPRSKRKTRTPSQKERISQKKEIRTILANIGFHRIPGIENNHFVYEDRQSELDDVFFLENVLLIVEYTVGHFKEHLAKKNLLYQKILPNPKRFIEFLLNNPLFTSIKDYYQDKVSPYYPNINQIQIRIVYCSREDVSEEYKHSVANIVFFDNHIVHYFRYLSAALRFSAKYEFLDFLGVSQEQFGSNVSVNRVTLDQTQVYILPEVKTFFESGYKVVTFYMEPEAILKRAYVLRHEGWRDKSSSTYFQRMAEPKRISSIRKYLVSEKRVFVNNIIVTLSEIDVTFFDNKNQIINVDESGQFDSEYEYKPGSLLMTLNAKRNTIGIIDGQHRVFSYHEDDDVYETEIAKLRKEQNLLVTGILFPRKETLESRHKFEAILFKEINVKQTKISSYLQQELDMIVSPFSTISVGKLIMYKLNQSGPIGGKVEVYSFEKGKIKSSSIVSFGLRPLIKYSEDPDSLFSIWEHDEKNSLKEGKEVYPIRDEYIDYCASVIRDILVGFKNNLPSDEWSPYDPKGHKGLLTTTFMNGILNLLRLIVQNYRRTFTIDEYTRKLIGVDSFKFKDYKSSHYRQLGEDLFDTYFRASAKE